MVVIVLDEISGLTAVKEATQCNDIISRTKKNPRDSFNQSFVRILACAAMDWKLID